MPVGIENIDKAIARARHVVVFFIILLGVGDKEITIDVLDAEWRETGRNVRIGEVTVSGYRDVHTIAAVRSGAEHVDGPGAEVRGKEKDTVNIGAKNQTL